MLVDFRSDTVTKPTIEMLEAMYNAKVGDDVFEEDPTINALEHKCAQLFGKPSGLFCPSGTQSNQIAIGVHTKPGDEIICDALSHIYVYEGGGIAAISGVTTALIEGKKGQLTAGKIENEIKEDNVHFPNTSLVSLENTCNKAGGTVYGLNAIKSIQKLCKTKNINLHLDGARIFNAITASDYSSHQIGGYFDTISICLSKGLGAPVGSVLVGTSAFIHQARRLRKRLGGGMRQAGYLAAAGIYALDNHIERLEIDHKNAQLLGEVFQECSFVTSVTPVETNIVMVHFETPQIKLSVLKRLEKDNIKALSLSNTSIRLVTHLDISSEQLQYAIESIRSIKL